MKKKTTTKIKRTIEFSVNLKKIESLVTKELKKYVEPKYMPRVKEKVLKMVNKEINKLCCKQDYKEFIENIDIVVSKYVQSEFALCEIQDIN